MNSVRKLIAVATAALAISAVWAGAAQACNYTGAQQVFKPWGDQHSYVLAPDGGLEAGGQGWYLGGGGTTVAENETFDLTGEGDSRSLALPAVSSAVSLPICM